MHLHSGLLINYKLRELFLLGFSVYLLKIFYVTCYNRQWLLHVFKCKAAEYYRIERKFYRNFSKSKENFKHNSKDTTTLHKKKNPFELSILELIPKTRWNREFKF